MRDTCGTSEDDLFAGGKEDGCDRYGEVEEREEESWNVCSPSNGVPSL